MATFFVARENPGQARGAIAAGNDAAHLSYSLWATIASVLCPSARPGYPGFSVRDTNLTRSIVIAHALHSSGDIKMEPCVDGGNSLVAVGLNP